MAASKPLGSTGKANVVKQGHTASGAFGTDPSKKAQGPRTPRDLNVK